MRILFFGLLAMVMSASAGQGAEPIRPEHFLKLHALIKPQAAEEKFMQSPWRTNLWEARKEAAKEGKPVLLWEMDGHPLSCV